MRKLIILVLIIGVMAAGCGRPSEEKAMAEVARQYVEAIASNTLEVAWPLTAGRQSEVLLQDIPHLLMRPGERKIEDLYVYVDYLKGNKGAAIASYVQTESIPDVGTSRARFKMVFEMVKLDKAWKIVEVHLLERKGE
ncbi:MAG: hypothetical protein QW835_04305 [Candidatus Hadarchaeum sp.]